MRSLFRESHMHMRRVLAVSLALLAILCCAGFFCSAWPKIVELQAHTQARLNEFQSADGLPGATMAVVLPSGEEFVVGAGLSNLETKTQMRPTDRMLAGSIGKTFFATIFLRMTSAGQMHLDDKISQ